MKKDEIDSGADSEKRSGYRSFALNSLDDEPECDPRDNRLVITSARWQVIYDIV